MKIAVQYDKNKYGHNEDAFLAVLEARKSDSARRLELVVSYPHPVYGISIQGNSKVQGFDLSMSASEARRFAAAIFRALDGDEDQVVVTFADGA